MTERPLDEFYRLHDAIVGKLNFVRPLMNVGHEQARVLLPEVRHQFTDAMRRFQVYKHSKLYDPHIYAGSPRREAAQALKSRCIKLGDDYDDYCRKWNVYQALADWPAFRLAALAMMAEIRASLAEEAEIVVDMKLYPIAFASEGRKAAGGRR